MSAAARPRPAYRCTDCAASALQWHGRCPECQAWGTLSEVAAAGAARASGLKGALRAGPVSSAARPVGEIDLAAARHVPTGIGELDRVLGGGLVPGSVVLLAGEPGVGKSTLLLEVAAASARAGRRALVVTGEESAGQVRLRAERTGSVHAQLWLAAETDLAAVLGQVEAVEPALLVVDSVQTVASADLEGTAGGPTQVREVAAALSRVAKERGMVLLLIGHVTKDGAVAGPRTLEHLVDVVLHAEGDRHSTLRLLRGVKNRFGAADEVGCFEQTETGLAEVPDPSGLFLSERREAVPGTCVTVGVDGRRALVTEVQALVGERREGAERLARGVSGLDRDRVQMLLAVAGARAGVALGGRDVYVATVGGGRLLEPAADLAVCLAVASASTGSPVASDVVAVGEVGLSGEVRRVPAVRRRLAEAARLGFATALVPAGCGPAPTDMRLLEVGDLRAAVHLALR